MNQFYGNACYSTIFERCDEAINYYNKLTTEKGWEHDAALRRAANLFDVPEEMISEAIAE